MMSDQPSTSSSLHLAQLSSLAAAVTFDLTHTHRWTCLTTHTLPFEDRLVLTGYPPATIQAPNPAETLIMPLSLDETFSLRQWAGVFDAADQLVSHRDGEEKRRWGSALLGIVSADSTVVYYTMHDGIVKPKQN
ncbi:hypothetical protein SAICODRAFT_28720 [Saitoella complicata NRRL Y-17804]|uniref:tRNA-splicing endonuclease subunit Sen15 domain-containing protein n=1 Tax=Saitoella complicata (strain BCRC 22490 / CBS 7301 / JCM 7358 / NBRC 10748 / NRRL Y-17804) TaxID=698492 RepID=A0A0E9N863_SAICN|nr:uncharacterized protein SAICODRAFT_28720 [Saitoella complicata NRRL Y-17804]ODQ55604.1 hypothetical protein SAICODRAFT_28720 [Saitoella complicata NRRL Y-17804]GAO46019.1 hypothetical protein G7K_0264-t1 [Saitoella complicata NRRL Y-17804]